MQGYHQHQPQGAKKIWKVIPKRAAVPECGDITPFGRIFNIYFYTVPQILFFHHRTKHRFNENPQERTFF